MFKKAPLQKRIVRLPRRNVPIIAYVSKRRFNIKPIKILYGGVPLLLLGQFLNTMKVGSTYPTLLWFVGVLMVAFAITYTLSSKAKQE